MMADRLDSNIKSVTKGILAKNAGQKYATGLVLSGGAAHGFAHLGVIKALHERNLVPDIVSGASAGAIIGSFYADGYAPEEIIDLFEHDNLFHFVNLKLKKHGLFDISGLRKLLQNNLRTKRLEDLPKPLIVAATNISRASIEYMYQGSLVDAVVASSSIPVLFNPVKIGSHHYVDGGVTDNFPVEPLINTCHTIVGVNVNPVGGFDFEESGLIQTAIHAFHMSVSSRVVAKKKYLTYFIEPLEMEGFSYLDMQNRREMMEVGYREAIGVLGK